MKRKIAILLVLSMILSGCSSSKIKTTSGYTSLDFKYLKEHKSYKDENIYHTSLADPREISDKWSIVSVKRPSSKRPQMNFDNIRFDSIWGYNYIDQDVSDQDFSKIDSKNIKNISFSSQTKWPSLEFLPEGFDPDSILEINKTPGLNVKDLHKKGINGEGVGIAIIDQTLFYDHSEYKDQIAYYEEIHNTTDYATLHGSGLASISVGKNIGVAPNSKLYYIASTFFHGDSENAEYDLSIIADCIKRVVEINSYLKPDEKIRVIAIAYGPSPDQRGYNDYIEAFKLAEEDNILVISTSSSYDIYETSVLGLNKDYTSNPDDYTSYYLLNVEQRLYSYYSGSLLFPMGSKTYASPSGDSEYEISYKGGSSWRVPWMAGFYALCCQVKPDITPMEFFDIIRANGDTFVFDSTNNSYGIIVNPTATIDYLLNN